MITETETSVAALSTVADATSDNPQPARPASSPHFPFDITVDRAKRFEELVEQYDAWHAKEPVAGPLPITTGIHVITPEQAEELLRRNLPGANRSLRCSTIIYYANQMKAGEWPLTGQPLDLRCRRQAHRRPAPSSWPPVLRRAVHDVCRHRHPGEPTALRLYRQ